MFVVGGHGYVGTRVLSTATSHHHDVTAVSRDGDTRREQSSLAWSDFLATKAHTAEPTSVVWVLDGAKHAERDRLDEFLAAAGSNFHLALASSCTVYGNRGGGECSEATAESLITPNAVLKASCEAAVKAASVSWSILRLGALYGTDDRGVRRDRVEKWVTEAAENGTVTVPEPQHWRGWLHRDQAARALYRAAANRVDGTFNVASSNHRFGDAAGFAAAHFGAAVQADGKEDLLNYKITSEKAFHAGILDEEIGEDIQSVVANFVEQRRNRLP